MCWLDSKFFVGCWIASRLIPEIHFVFVFSAKALYVRHVSCCNVLVYSTTKCTVVDSARLQFCANRTWQKPLTDANQTGTLLPVSNHHIYSSHWKYFFHEYITLYFAFKAVAAAVPSFINFSFKVLLYIVKQPHTQKPSTFCMHAGIIKYIFILSFFLCEHTRKHCYCWIVVCSWDTVILGGKCKTIPGFMFLELPIKKLLRTASEYSM